MSKRKCPLCRSSRVIGWGKNRSGSQRFRCADCGVSGSLKRKDSTRRNRLPWLKRWLYGSTVSAVAETSRRSRETVRRNIRQFLDGHPSPRPIPNSSCHLIIDATWFKRNHCLLVYWDHDKQWVQRWRYTDSENGAEITHDLKLLKDNGVVCSSITSDGSKGINTAVNLVYPNIPHQRCLVHIRRQALAWLTRNPKTIPGLQIKPLVKQLAKIETWEQANQWAQTILDWEKRWGNFLKQRSYFPGTSRWWYTHRSLRKVRVLIIHALPDLFHYLDDPAIPKTSNGLEGRFGSLKNHYRQHRGLTKQRRQAYLGWYLTVVVNGEKPTRFDY